MTLPVEDYIAAFPPSTTAGNVTLNPLTIRHAVLLSRDGIDIGAPIPHDRVFDAAFVLSGAKDKRKFLKGAKCGLQELCNALETVLNSAFVTYVSARPSAHGPKKLTPHGLGWALELAEFMCGEYGWSWDTALDMPVATTWALAVAARQRHGGEHGGLDYEERRYGEDLKSGKAKPVRIR